MLYFEKINADQGLSQQDLAQGVQQLLQKRDAGQRVLIIPPDYTRAHSFAGMLTRISYQQLGDKVKAILPALGTHSPMTREQIEDMYAGIPAKLFRIHNWRQDVLTAGYVPAEFVARVSEDKVRYDWPVQYNKLLIEGKFDLILSIGQVVPHEVAGMANFYKNILVGVGGSEGINKSHFIGAAYGIERILGKIDNPVQKVFHYGMEHFVNDLPIVYLLTVVGKDHSGQLKPMGLFIGDDERCFQKAAQLSLQVNFTTLEKPLQKVVVYLDPSEYKSTWLGNKSVYRTRMAIADDGELIVLAPGIKEFGEDRQIDHLIRKYGYQSSHQILNLVKTQKDLQNNLAAAAHLIHGSHENRFKIIYCPGYLTREEIESVHYQYADLQTMLQRYDISKLDDGFNIMPDGEKIYFISNPALGLWAYKNKLTE